MEQQLCLEIDMHNAFRGVSVESCCGRTSEKQIDPKPIVEEHFIDNLDEMCLLASADGDINFVQQGPKMNEKRMRTKKCSLLVSAHAQRILGSHQAKAQRTDTPSLRTALKC